MQLACSWDFTREEISGFFQPWSDPPSQDLQHIDAHPMSRIALDLCSELDQVEAIDIFTDGSFCPPMDSTPARGAWAFVVFGRGFDHDGSPKSQWIGHYSGQAIDHIHPDHETHGLGVIDLSPYETERSALWWAAAYLLQREDTCPAYIHYDSNAAGDAASGRASSSCSTDDVGIGATLRGIFQLLGRRRSVEFRHVKGHTGQAGNELADAVASAQCRGHIADCTPNIPVQVLTRVSKHFMQWIFAEQSANDRPQLGHNVVMFPGFQAAEQLPFAWRPGDVLKPSRFSAVDLQLKVVSYNDDHTQTWHHQLASPTAR